MASILAVIHFTWRVKKDVGEPAMCAAVLATLLIVRVVVSLPSRLARPPPEALRERRV